MLYNSLKSFSIFADRGKAIKMAIERFDDETRESFMSLYQKIDAGISLEDEEDNTVSTEEEFDERMKDED